ncbi:DUF448 domain-containing protein [Epidermidibacterium keratini]|uniref:DUF448 domain-containing protein n=1 Tax=Epidermidibacterium keratini TaxID=1891644 RepID=A0A7L4YTM9_9ACTN|nr:DUF448 domain-containing protein [Epidermidibacterium keratini]
MNPRTCIGCRQRADATELVRFVADQTAPAVVLADPHRRRQGRGCHLHPSWKCYEQAVRRRAFVRALRLSAPVDLARVEQALVALAVDEQPK